MDPFLITLIAVLLGAVMLAFYMDWLGLWVSKAAMKEQNRSGEGKNAWEAIGRSGTLSV